MRTRKQHELADRTADEPASALLPVDFVEYVSHERGIEREAAMELLREHFRRALLSNPTED